MDLYCYYVSDPGHVVVFPPRYARLRSDNMDEGSDKMRHCKERVLEVSTDLDVDHMEEECSILKPYTPVILDELMWIDGAFMEPSMKDVGFAIQRALLDYKGKPLLLPILEEVKYMWIDGAFMEPSMKDVGFAVQRAVLDYKGKPLLLPILEEVKYMEEECSILKPNTPVILDELMWIDGAFMEPSMKDVGFAIQRAVLDYKGKPLLLPIRLNGDPHFYPLRRKRIYQSMEIEGSIQNLPILFLIDTGSNLNFISKRCAEMLGLERVPVQKFSVVVANDAKMEVTDMCENVEWRGQGVDFKANFYVLPMHSSEAILGIQWLVTLGTIQWNFSSRTMQFQQGDKMVCLNGAAMDDDVGQASSEEGSRAIQHASACLSPAVSVAIQPTTACVVPAC